MKKKHLILLGIVLATIVIPVVAEKVYNTLSTADSTYRAYCSTVQVGVENRVSALYKGNDKIIELDGACHTNSLTETRNYVYLDSGTTISRINKEDQTAEYFEYSNKNPNEIEIGNAQNIMYGKISNYRNNSYLSMFPISSDEIVIKYLSNDNYSQYYLPVTEARVFEAAGTLHVLGLTDSYSKLEHYTFELTDEGLINEKLHASYNIADDMSFFPTSFFMYDGKLTTISTGEECTLNYVQFGTSHKLDVITNCDNTTFKNVGDNYEISKVYQNTLYIDFKVSESGSGVKEVIFYKVNLEDMSFEKVVANESFKQHGTSTNVLTYVDRGKMYVAAEENFFTTPIYEVAADGSMEKIDSQMKINFSKPLKSFIPKSAIADDINSLDLSYADENVADKLRELGALWLSLDDQLTLEYVEEELQFFHEYAAEQSARTGESIEQIISDMIDTEKQLYE
ncbi:hypothetical protein RZE82_00115 [Mollicutes bacterium LVI A0039]|nr:hypothetical protein RZE82_00115 [Mollicutes bacterium LVI A0039]